MPQLTPAELQEVNRFLDAGKPLPDKYRFLLFEDKREVELVWNGKTNEVTNAVLPFQVIEQVDEPRAEVDTKLQMSMFDVDERGRQLKGWQNKLIWGDNKLILSSLKNGPLREEIEKQGGIKLIYIDPPFDVGADFSMDIEIGDDSFTKKANILEEIAYRDTWGKGSDSFISMMYERLILMRDLLSEDGSIFVHCDWRVNSYLRSILGEVFGNENFINQICWRRTTAHGDAKQGAKRFDTVDDTILAFSKNSDKRIWNTQYIPFSDEQIKQIEEFVNAAIKTGGDVTVDFMPKTQAEADETVEGSFWDRYPDEVKVYTVTGQDGTVFSRELCGGPHVEKLEDIAGTFKITKEESSSAGIRRIKATLV